MVSSCRFMLVSLVCAVSAAGAACAPQVAAPAVHPSASQQEALAAQDEDAARNYLVLAAEKRTSRCSTNQKLLESDACWAPTSDAYRAASREHMRLASSHRAAAQKLRDAEANACDGVSDLDRDISPFAHTEDIVRVEPIAAGSHADGARVFFRLVHGLSRAKLQHIVDCHLAQADELGHQVPEESFCPLNPPNAQAVVKDAADGYVVEVTSSDPEAGREIMRRAMALKGPAGPGVAMAGAAR